jgi:CTP:molybdopterin cytidylyltransferase MocA
MRTVTAVLLAAGESARFGRPKLLESVGGEPLVARTARALLDGGAAEVAAVVGAHGREVAGALSPLPVRIVPNHGWWMGMFSSVLAGLRAVEGAACVAVTPSDLPFLDASDVARTIAAMTDRPPSALVVACHEGRRGHPLVFQREVAARVLGWHLERRLSELFAEPDLDVVSVECGRGVVRDVDVPRDLAS